MLLEGSITRSGWVTFKDEGIAEPPAAKPGRRPFPRTCPRMDALPSHGRRHPASCLFSSLEKPSDGCVRAVSIRQMTLRPRVPALPSALSCRCRRYVKRAVIDVNFGQFFLQVTQRAVAETGSHIPRIPKFFVLIVKTQQKRADTGS